MDKRETVFFGVPTCPYCKKRVNLIRTWSLKRQGEYQCPRCGGISNIFLSPLIYIFALLAVFAGGAMYFFHKFVLDDVSLTTLVQVFVPFAVFFFLSLFMVYLAKPVIKKVPKAELEGKRRVRSSPEERRQPRDASARDNRMFRDDQEYLPRGEYLTGPIPRMEDDRDMKVVPAGPVRPTRPAETPGTVKVSPAPQKPVPQVNAAPAVQKPDRRAEAPAQAAPRRQVQKNVSRETVSRQPKAVSQIEVPNITSNEDFFAKYNDPDYVERRLKELQRDRQKSE